MRPTCWRTGPGSIKRDENGLVARSKTDIKAQVERISFEHTKKVTGGSVEIVFYDMTTLYFEAAEEDDLRKAGFSKDGKHSCPQIFLGLLVTTGGNPIGYEIYEGNIFEEHTLIPVIEKLAKGQLTKASINNRGYNKYLKMEGEVTISIDMDKFNADAAWDGIKAYLTNTDLSKEDVIANYGNLWYIERAFRMNKSDLRVRPIYHRLRNRIEGHICICFTAYTVLLELERLLKAAGSILTLARVRETVKTMYRLNYISPNTRRPMSILLRMDAEQKQVYDLVHPAR